MYFLKVHFKYNFSQLISRKAYMLQESWQHASCLPAWLRKDFKYLPSPVVLMIFVFCLPQPSSSWAGNFIAKESLLIWGSSWKWVLLWVKNKELHDVSFFSSVYQNHPEGLFKKLRLLASMLWNFWSSKPRAGPWIRIYSRFSADANILVQRPHFKNYSLCNTMKHLHPYH